MRFVLIVLSQLIITFSLFTCKSSSDPTPIAPETPTIVADGEFLVKAENFTASTKGVEVISSADGEKYVKANRDGWLALEVDVPVAGRYQIQLQLAPLSDQSVNCWVEDYYDNEDERTYNVTGNLAFPGPSDRFSVNSKDGSPLNAGVHKMKLHFDGAMHVDWIKFKLLKKQQKTPKTLTQNTSGDDWELVWSDEFSEGEVDTSKWTYDIGNWGWGNNELQYYTANRPENARIENGNLIIEARKNDLNEPWTSARLTTRGKVSFLYGKIEFRAKVPAERGNWAAGWTLGDEYVDELSWPYCGEIDILESVGYEMDDETGNGIAHASAHSRAYYFKLGNQPTATVPVENMKEEFHTYAVEWAPDGMTIMVDDQPYFTYNDTTTAWTWPFNKSQNIILNLAMGGGWGGAQGMDESVNSQKMIVDYVRVYERK